MNKVQLKQLIKEVIQEDADTEVFTLKIRLGNAECNRENVPDLLRGVADRIEAGKDYGRIMDINGNNVGEFSF